MQMSLLLGALLVGCKAPPEAPAELDDLGRYFYQNWSQDEELKAALSQLDTFLVDVDVDGGIQQRSWEIGPLVDENVVEIDRPDRPLENVLAMAIARGSEHEALDHALLQAKGDQAEWEPSSKGYLRSFPSDREPECFVNRACEVMASVNEVERKNALIAVNFNLFKSFRWVDTPNGEAIVSRSWFEESAEGEGGNTTLWQSYAIDAWVPRDDGTLTRFEFLWSESDVGPFGENLVLGTMKSGVDAIFKAHDDAITDGLHEN